MFESKEEVNNAIMELKMFETMETIPDENNPEDEEDCEDLRQVTRKPSCKIWHKFL